MQVSVYRRHNYNNETWKWCNVSCPPPKTQDKQKDQSFFARSAREIVLPTFKTWRHPCYREPPWKDGATATPTALSSGQARSLSESSPTLFDRRQSVTQSVYFLTARAFWFCCIRQMATLARSTHLLFVNCIKLYCHHSVKCWHNFHFCLWQ